MSSILALIISPSRIQPPSIPNVITEAIKSGSSKMTSLFIDRLNDVTDELDVLFTVNNSRGSKSSSCTLLNKKVIMLTYIQMFNMIRCTCL